MILGDPGTWKGEERERRGRGRGGKGKLSYATAAYSEDFLDWLNVGLYGNKRAVSSSPPPPFYFFYLIISPSSLLYFFVYLFLFLIIYLFILQAITFSIEATILRLKTQVGSLGKAIGKEREGD